MMRTALAIGAMTALLSAGAISSSERKQSNVTEPLTSSPAPRTPSSAAGNNTFALPNNYVLKSARNSMVKCDGVTDDTAALQDALNDVEANSALELPAGTCVYRGTLTLFKKANVVVLGAGSQSTILRASNPSASSFIVSGGSNISLHGFQIHSPNSTTRTNDGNGRGIYVDHASDVMVDDITIQNVSGAGILYNVVHGGKITNSRVLGSLADAYHVTGGSRDIVIRDNVTSGAGDDCFASIGYGSELNTNIQFLENNCFDNRASGISFEGTIGGVAYGNQLSRTGVSGIRIASIRSWGTGEVRNIDLRNNVLDEVRTRQDVDHAAIMVFTTAKSIDSVSIRSTRINNPNTHLGMRIVNYVPAYAKITNITYADSALTSNGTLKKCVSRMPRRESGIEAVTLSGNTLNTVPC